MDPRHETWAQETCNHIILCINHYVQDNVSDILEDESLRANLKSIVNLIYGYADYTLDLEALMDKHNFLSIDIVPLPLIDELVVERNQSFIPVLAEIKLILAKNKKDKREIYQILNDTIAKCESVSDVK